MSLLASLAVALLIWIGALTEPPLFWPIALLIPAIVALRFRHFATQGVVWYTAVAIATLALTHAVFFGEDRYHLVVTPLLCILAARAFTSREREESGHAAGR
jgi:hypothetical protein